MKVRSITVAAVAALLVYAIAEAGSPFSGGGFIPATGGGLDVTKVPSGTSANAATTGQGWMFVGGSWQPDYPNDPQWRAAWVEEFDGQGSATVCNVGKFTGYTQGTAATCTYSTLENGSATASHPGLWVLTTGSQASANNGAGGCTKLGAYVFGDGAGGAGLTQCVDGAVDINALTTVGTDQQIFRLGFSNTANNGEGSNDVWAMYDATNNSSFQGWVLKTCANSVCASLKADGTGGTVNEPISAGVWYHPRVCSDGHTAKLYINGTLAASTTTDVPAGVSQATGICVLQTRAGTTSATGLVAYVDWVAYVLPFSTAR